MRFRIVFERKEVEVDIPDTNEPEDIGSPGIEKREEEKEIEIKQRTGKTSQVDIKSKGRRKDYFNQYIEKSVDIVKSALQESNFFNVSKIGLKFEDVSISATQAGITITLPLKDQNARKEQIEILTAQSNFLDKFKGGIKKYFENIDIDYEFMGINKRKPSQFTFQIFGYTSLIKMDKGSMKAKDTSLAPKIKKFETKQKEIIPLMLALKMIQDNNITVDYPINYREITGMEDEAYDETINYFESQIRNAQSPESLDSSYYNPLIRQAELLYEIFKVNPAHKPDRGIEYDLIRNRGLNLWNEQLKTIFGEEAKKISRVDKWNPSDFIMIKSDYSPSGFADMLGSESTLIDFHRLFANDLLQHGKISPVDDKFKYIGISQKRDVSDQQAGATTTYLLDIKGYNLISHKEEIADVKKFERHKVVEKLYNDTKNEIEMIARNEKVKIHWDFKDDPKGGSPIKNVYKFWDKAISDEDIQKRYRSLSAFKNLISEGLKGFTNLVKFAMSAGTEKEYPPFFKVVANQIHAFNTKHYRVEFDKESELLIDFPHTETKKGTSPNNSIDIKIPVIFITSDVGKEKEHHYRIKMNFYIGPGNVTVFGRTVDDMTYEKKNQEAKDLIKALEKRYRAIKNNLKLKYNKSIVEDIIEGNKMLINMMINEAVMSYEEEFIKSEKLLQSIEKLEGLPPQLPFPDAKASELRKKDFNQLHGMISKLREQFKLYNFIKRI